MLDVLALFKYWNEWPPTHEILKYVHGGDSKKKTDAVKVTESRDQNDPSGIGDLMGQIPGAFVNNM